VLLTIVVAAGVPYGIYRLVRWRPVLWRPRCLACSGKLALRGALVGTRVDGFGKRYPTSWVSYRCKRCKAEFVEESGKPLVTREAWEASEKAPVPGARVVE
jgi:hypothetical protein